ncbi:MAG TPA: hypothetical protein VN699_10010 [Pirellulales bacterium]|nr:hypothetical protein [Pirellulales bacterium]
MNVELWQTVNRCFQNNDVAGAASYLESHLRAHSLDRFTSLAEKHFTNSPQSVLEHINKFIDRCKEQCEVAAVYLEMNGFDANYDRWYFDSFAYTDYRDDPDDLDWLCDWSSPKWPQLTLTGLEDIQEDFKWYMENEVYDKNTHNAGEELAVLLVMVRFVQLTQAALESGNLAKPIPVLATAHDFDIFGRFAP